MAAAQRSWAPGGTGDRARRASRSLVAVALMGLVACTGEEVPDAGSGPSRSSSTSLSPSTKTSDATPSSPTPTTDAQRVRALLGDPAPTAEEVIALAKTPMAWTRAKDRLLVEYGVMPRSNWPSDATLVAVRILDSSGRVRGEWVDGLGDESLRDYWPVGGRFVGLPAYGGIRTRPVLVRDGSLVELSRVPGARTIRLGDVRFGQGWLLDEAARTVTRERRPGCRQDSIRTDAKGRTWCLDPAKKQILWTHTGGGLWMSHVLSTSYFDYCDGGAPGADVAVLGDVVVVGLWRADVSFDGGASWQDLELPTRVVNTAPGGLGDNCPWVEPLEDGRLVLSSIVSAVATDATNSRFTLVRVPPGTGLAYNTDEGVFVAASRRPYGDRFASFDGGDTWQPLRSRALVRHLLPQI